MSDYEFVQPNRGDERQRTIEYIHFVALREMPDVDKAELRAMLRDEELIKSVMDLGECVSRETVKTQIEATLAMRALKADAPVDR